MKKVVIKGNPDFKPSAVGCEFEGGEVICVNSVDAHSSISVEVAKEDVRKVIGLLRRDDIDFIEFTGSVMLCLSKELKDKWIAALENPINDFGV